MPTAHTVRSHARHFRRSRAAAVAALVFAAGGAIASRHAAAAVISWNNAAGGPTSTAANWSPVQIPAAADDQLFSLAGAYSVTHNATVPVSRTHTYRQGTVTLSVSSPHTVSTGITIGDTNALAGTMTLSSGTLNSTASVNLGLNVGSTGNLNVTDDSADLLINGAGADLTVGVNGDAALSITGGGLVQAADQFIAGSNSTTSPIVTVSGAQAVSPFQRSRLSVLGTGVSSKFGQGGDATVNISNGALADFAGDLVVSNGSASVSTVTLAGSGGLGNILDATLDVAGDLFLGQNIDAVNPGGTATMTVNADGRLLVGGTLHVGNDPNGGTGTLNINTGGLVQAASVIDGSFGTINHTGGTLRINGGTYTGIAVPYSVSGAAANLVTLAWANNAAQTLVPAGGVSLIVGDDLGAGAFQGFLNVESGADLDMGNGDINIGDDTGVTGTVTITGAGSRLIANSVNSDVRAGFNGTGVVEVQSGGQLLRRNLLVPALSNAIGDMNCTGSGSNITTQFLAIGHAAGAGNGRLDVQLEATLNITDPGFSTNIRSTGILALGTASTITTPGTITVDAGGLFSVGGTVANATLVDVNGGVLRSNLSGSSTPLVDAPVRIRPSGALEAVFEDFTVGDAASTAGFVADIGSIITIGATVLTLLDSDAADVDTVTLAGGSLAAPSGIDILNNGTIDGTGTITTPELFFNSGGGVITATGADGITINGRLRNNSGNIDGTKYTFNANGPQSGWFGAGAINAQVVFNSGTAVNALANMTMGVNSAFGVTFNPGSELHADTRTVTLLDSNGIGLPSVTDLIGGHVVCAENLTVNTGRRLSGRGGSIDSPLVTVFGRLSPGELVGEPIGETGELTINGNLTLGVNSDTDIEIQGLVGPLEYDRVVVNGVATLAGNLNVSLISGFNPVAPGAWIIISGPSIIGAFSSTSLPPHFSVQYSPTAVRLIFCPANFNGVNGVTVQDIYDFLAAWNSGLPAADFNGVNGVTVQDIYDFLGAWNAGCP